MTYDTINGKLSNGEGLGNMNARSCYLTSKHLVSFLAIILPLSLIAAGVSSSEVEVLFESFAAWGVTFGIASIIFFQQIMPWPWLGGILAGLSYIVINLIVRTLWVRPMNEKLGQGWIAVSLIMSFFSGIVMTLQLFYPFVLLLGASIGIFVFRAIAGGGKLGTLISVVFLSLLYVFMGGIFLGFIIYYIQVFLSLLGIFIISSFCGKDPVKPIGYIIIPIF